jgi:hypothetical protein
MKHSEPGAWGDIGRQRYKAMRHGIRIDRIIYERGGPSPYRDFDSGAIAVGLSMSRIWPLYDYLL